MNRFSALFQFIVGFFVGVLLLVSGTAALAYVVFYRLNIDPPKPTFAEEKPKPKETTKSKPKAQETAKKTKEEVAAKKPEPEPSPEVEENKEEETTQETEELPQGAYKASVNWPQGLSLRAEPGQDADRIGGVGYQSELIILKTSSDGDWQKVRLPRSGQEGWVKAGNVDKLED
ncbi:MAG TPA: peptide-binding protein [Cyanothece sp. UBA12306]|nr:peptide-binding protein [Cyanothece sp. UBA12306]